MKPIFQFNKSAGRLEISFPAVPSRQIRFTLKESGFWWDGANKVWHLAKPVNLRIVRAEPVPQNGFAYALDQLQTYCGLDKATREQIERDHSFHCQQQAEIGMEMACGIA